MQFSFFSKAKEATSPSRTATVTLKACPQQETSQDLFHESISGFLEERMDTFGIQEANAGGKQASKKRKSVTFSEEIIFAATYSSKEYNRKGEFLVRPLTPQIVNAIKRELNEFKREMKIHSESQKYTQFYQLC